MGKRTEPFTFTQPRTELRLGTPYSDRFEPKRCACKDARQSLRGGHDREPAALAMSRP